jgi:phenylalanyl-tRNA synthetase alpha chain
MSIMKELSPEEKPRLGAAANTVKSELATLFTSCHNELEKAEDDKAVSEDRIDVSLPPRTPWTGGVHPLTHTLRTITDIFVTLGFAVKEGPEIEDEWHNFDALNIPADHPARDAQDTFFVKSDTRVDHTGNEYVLRTHTSPVQIRVMKENDPPVRFIAPGRVYRNETIDASHYTIFNQVEGLYVDKNVSFAQLKGTLLSWAHAFFGKNVSLRFRPSYFPFTEPSAEVDVTCTVCKGKGCSVCKHSGWVEILGAGMVHPRVLHSVNYDSDIYTGFAFGMGIERIAILKYGIDDIRLFYENDIRFLTQFA